jgi:hypothetical protein
MRGLQALQHVRHGGMKIEVRYFDRFDYLETFIRETKHAGKPGLDRKDILGSPLQILIHIGRPSNDS